MMSDADAIVGLYDRHARDWAADRGTVLLEGVWLDRFRALLPDCGAVLDLGCGSGQPIARSLVEAGHHVCGVDSSAAMIGLCRDALPGQEWIVGDMRSLALGRRFAGVLAWDSFFHLSHDDQRRMFSVFAAHARPGAALMFTSGPDHGIAMGAYRGEALFHASLAPDEYRALLAAHGFEVVHHIAGDPACGGHTVWLARLS